VSKPRSSRRSRRRSSSVNLRDARGDRCGSVALRERVQVALASRKTPHVHLDGPRGSHGSHLRFLQHAQKQLLRRRRQVFDDGREERAALRAPSRIRPSSIAPANAPLQWPRSSDWDERGRESAAVHRNERSLPPERRGWRTRATSLRFPVSPDDEGNAGRATASARRKPSATDGSSVSKRWPQGHLAAVRMRAAGRGKAGSYGEGRTSDRARHVPSLSGSAGCAVIDQRPIAGAGVSPPVPMTREASRGQWTSDRRARSAPAGPGCFGHRRMAAGVARRCVHRLQRIDGRPPARPCAGGAKQPGPAGADVPDDRMSTATRCSAVMGPGC